MIHDEFFLSTYKELNIFIADIGLVGSSLLKQLQNQSKVLFDEHNLKVNLMGITNSRRMLVGQKPYPLINVKY